MSSLFFFNEFLWSRSRLSALKGLLSFASQATETQIIPHYWLLEKLSHIFLPGTSRKTALFSLVLLLSIQMLLQLNKTNIVVSLNLELHVLSWNCIVYFLCPWIWDKRKWKHNKKGIEENSGQVMLVVKNPLPVQETWRWRFDPWVEKIPWGGHGTPFQYSCLENPMGAWWAT